MNSADFFRAKSNQLRALATQTSVPEVIVQLELWAREFEGMAERAELPAALVVAPTPKFGGAR